MSEEATTETAPAPAPVQDTAPSDWREVLPGDLREHSAFRDIKDIGSLAKSYVHAQKLVGLDRSNLLTVPAADATPEERDEFYAKLGRPAEPKGYELPAAEGVSVDEATVTWYRDVAHKYGLNSEQARGLYQDYLQFGTTAAAERTAETEQTRAQGEASLRREWGAAYEQNLEIVAQTMKDHFPEEVVTMLNSTGLGNDPAMIQGLYNLAKSLGEDQVTDTGRRGDVLTPRQASDEIAQLESDPVFSRQYFNRDDPAHAQAVEKMSRLHRLAAGRR